MIKLKEITKEQEEELYIWKPNGGFHHKYIWDFTEKIWLELTEEEAKNRLEKSSENYKKKLEEGWNWEYVNDKIQFVKK